MGEYVRLKCIRCTCEFESHPRQLIGKVTALGLLCYSALLFV